MDTASILALVEALPFPLLACSPKGELLALSATAAHALHPLHAGNGGGPVPELRRLLARLASDETAVERLDGARKPLLARTFRTEKLTSASVLLVLLEEHDPGGAGDGIDPAAERARLIAALVPGIAHEVRGPLSTLSGMAQVLALDGRIDADIREPLAMVQAQVDRVDSLLRNFVAFAHGPSEGPDLPASIHDVLDRAQALLGHDLRARRIRVERKAEGQPALVGTDPEDLLLAVVALVRELVEEGACDGSPLSLLARGESSARLEIVVSLPSPQAPLRGRARALLERLGGTLAFDVDRGTGILTAAVGLPVWRDEVRPLARR